MLITNFAAGELSETLFGRIDLPQYYQGVSLLENFDVIPTGGIERRNGTKRIALKDAQGQAVQLEEGRIIPFLLDRENVCMLFLSPEKIQLYINGQLTNATLQSGLEAYKTMAEIHEIQYAQNNEMMILVQESYPPVMVSVGKLNDGSYKALIEKFTIDIEVEIRSTEDITAAEKRPYKKPDGTYQTQGYLQQTYQYPRCVTLFGGRVIFAGTITNPQRIFASRVTDPHNFSTHKIFLTKQRNYVAVEGTVTDDPYVITLTTAQDIAKLSGKLTDYIPNSPLIEGAKIVSLKGFDLRLSKPINLSNILTQVQRDELIEMDKALKNYNANKDRVWVSYNDAPTDPIDYRYYYYALVGASEVYWEYNAYGEPDAYHLLRPDLGWVALVDGAEAALSDAELDNILRYRIESFATNGGLPVGAVYHGIVTIPENINQAVALWRSRIRETMQYYFNGEWYYGFPLDILAKLEQQYGGTDQVYLSFYTEEILSDEYPTADDGFTFEIASDMSDAIRWIGQNKNILVGTETAEWIIPADTTAVNVRSILNSRYGSEKIQGTSVGDAMCFFQTGGRALVEYYIPQQDYNFRANNMAMLSKNMLHESPAFDFDFISAPYTKLFVSRKDGIIVALLYERSTGTFAWGRITTSGHIKSVATVPGPSGYDDVYMIVEREETEEGTRGYYLEMLAERRRSEDAPDAEVFLDSYGPWTGDAAGYSGKALIYDELNNRTYPVTEPPPVGPRMWIGYRYASRVRSMPVLANDQMKQHIIKNLHIRFNDSFLPRIKSLPNGKEDTIVRSEPYSGVIQIPFPGVWDRDVFFEFIHDKPTRVRVLAVNAEAN